MLYKLKKINKTMMKEMFFSFLNDIDVEQNLNEFWEKFYAKETKKFDFRIFPYG